jgi:TfoX/Sxy family transcriptional regulator of competence genes
MAYDEDLADRIREQIGGEPALSEKKMFGGLAFLLGGNMAIAASSKGGILVRVDPADADRLLRGAGVTPMEMQGRSMNGWLRVDAEHVRTKRQLERWVGIGSAYAASLPPKRSK